MLAQCSESTGCSSGGLKFNSQHPQGAVSLAVTPAPGDLRISLASVVTACTQYTQSTHTAAVHAGTIHKIKRKIKT